jgi:hypothetical protein
MANSDDNSLGEFEVDLRNCIWKDCKGDLIELEAYAQFNWLAVSYKCTVCEREFTVKIET